MTQSSKVLQLHIESRRVTQFIDGRWIERKDDGVLDGGKPDCSPGDDRLNRMFGAFALLPILQPAEGEGGILSAPIEAKTGDGDKALDFRLLQKIFLDLPQNLVGPVLG